MGQQPQHYGGGGQQTTNRPQGQGMGQPQGQGMGQPQGQRMGQPQGQPRQGYQQATGGVQAPGTQRMPQGGPRTGGRQQSLLTPVRVSEIITEDVVAVDPDTPVRTAVAEMAENDVGSVVVLEEERPVGVLTDRTVALALEEMPDVAERSAGELIDDDVVTADPSMSILDALDLMSDHGIRRLPIVDDDGALRGIVTLDDALVYLGSALGQVTETVDIQSERL